MANQSWLTTLGNAEKTSIIQDGKRKVHFKFSDGREMVEEYNLDTNVVLKRAWKTTKKFGAQPKWEVEIGDPDPLFTEEDNAGIKESSLTPITTARITKNSLEWRIRNLPYPLENYIVTTSPDDDYKIIIKTKNKKFFKKIVVHDLQRLGIKLEQNKIDVSHKFNTLVVSYKKPPALLLSEKLIFEEINKVETVKGDQCKQS